MLLSLRSGEIMGLDYSGGLEKAAIKMRVRGEVWLILQQKGNGILWLSMCSEVMHEIK